MWRKGVSSLKGQREIIFSEDEQLNFKEFDPSIGADGYCSAIRNVLFPNSKPATLDIAALSVKYRIYVRGSIFSRVRPIDNPLVDKFLKEHVTRKEFFPATRSVKDASIGRFNAQGVRKLYLADHPYVALKECGIEPGQHFLFSYFSFSADTYFMDAEPNETKFSKILHDLFQSEDRRFYEVINRVYESYLDYPEFQGLAYSSARVQKNYHDPVWGEIDSTTNLVMKEDHMPSAELLGGWLAICDEKYRPRYLRIFIPNNPKKKQKLVSTSYQGNKSKFISLTQELVRKTQDTKRKSVNRIKNKEYADPEMSPVKVLIKD